MSLYNIPDDYELSAGEVNNIVYITCRHTCDWTMREADLAVCDMLRDKTLRGDAAVENLLEVATEYVWDHIMGEPEDPTQKQLADHIRTGLTMWFQDATPAERQDISTS